MPTVLRIMGYRFFSYSLEGHEPPHIHVERDEKLAKYWLDPVELAKVQGFRNHELGTIRTLVALNRQIFRDAWYEHFRNTPGPKRG